MITDNPNEYWEDISEGRTSIKLEISNPEGTTSWVDFDLDNPALGWCGVVLVFNDLTGLYERFLDLDSARARQAEHKYRLRALRREVTEIPGVMNDFAASTNQIGVTVWLSQPTQSPSSVTFSPSSLDLMASETSNTPTDTPSTTSPSSPPAQ